VVVHGDRRNFCTAIVTIQEEAVTRWARSNAVPFTDYASLAARPEVKALIQQGVDQVNAELASYESIKKFAILDHDFSQETGELTPKMSIRRREVETRYQDLLDSFYSGAIERL
jgi:long-chain acyl-CoA synthetase